MESDTPTTQTASLTPYLCVRGAAEALEYYRDAFGAVETIRMPHPDGWVAHAEMKIGTASFMLADEFPEYGAISPKMIGGSPVTMVLQMAGVDEVFNRAIQCGATASGEVHDEPYGRTGKLVDPFGHIWMILTPPR